MAVHSTVSDQSGRPLQHAVVYATPKPERQSFPAGQPKAVMAVENFEFQPPVLVVQAGTGVSFLNRDDIRHQIYSISAAKNFELVAERLSSSAEVVFERPGVVVLGSAAHDRTIGHIYVLKTPYFATTGSDGKADLAALPRGAYEVRVWHPDMLAPVEATTRRVADSSERRVGVDFTIAVRNGRPPAPLPPPAAVPRHGGTGR
jgi:plastocyanin